MKQLLLLAGMLWIFTSQSQNITADPTLSQGWVNWNKSGCTPIIGGVYGYTGSAYWSEVVYGGSNASNLVAHVAGGACMQQVPNLIKGMSYKIDFKAQRRCESDNPDVPATVYLQLRVLGTTSFTLYVDEIYSYTNLTWNWKNESKTFTIPAGASDNACYFSITAYNATTSEHNAVVDDVYITPVLPVAVDGPTVAGLNAGTNWFASNLPVTGVSYAWSFPGANTPTSTNANPTNIQWATPGIKTVTVVVGNGTGDLFTITKNIEVTNTLPLDMLAFSATEKTGTVELQWTTANEVLTDYFGVYKSKDGVNFNEIGRVKASNLVAGSSYKFSDAQPGAAMVYYRLRPVDKNGSYKTTGVVKLRMGKVYLDVNVYPTIINSVLDYAVETPRAGKMMVLINDMSGRNVYTKSEVFNVGANKRNIDASLLAKGAYLLTVKDGTGFIKTIKFTKN
jgi:hypothetical protein